MVTTHIDKAARILNVGAGNSRLSEEMLEEGYNSITNIDISNVCVKAMK
jgi:EEF1A lysine methyltransferase 4